VLAALAVGPVAQAGGSEPLADARIRRSGGPLYGNNIYNDTGDNQAVHLKVYAGEKRIVYISIQNDGDAAGEFVLGLGPYSVAPGHHFRLFVGRTDQDITNDVVDAIYHTPALSPGETFLIRVRVWVTDETAPGVVSYQGIRIASEGLSSLDQVTIWVQRK